MSPHNYWGCNCLLLLSCDSYGKVCTSTLCGLIYRYVAGTVLRAKLRVCEAATVEAALHGAPLCTRSLPVVPPKIEKLKYLMCSQG
jgi:hypothetical protein